MIDKGVKSDKEMRIKSLKSIEMIKERDLELEELMEELEQKRLMKVMRSMMCNTKKLLK